MLTRESDLADRVLRAAQSRNIPEGAGRRTPVDPARFYAHARGSAMKAAAALDLEIHVQGGVQVQVQVRVSVKVNGTVLSDRHCR